MNIDKSKPIKVADYIPLLGIGIVILSLAANAAAYVILDRLGFATNPIPIPILGGIILFVGTYIIARIVFNLHGTNYKLAATVSIISMLVYYTFISFYGAISPFFSSSFITWDKAFDLGIKLLSILGGILTTKIFRK